MTTQTPEFPGAKNDLELMRLHKAKLDLLEEGCRRGCINIQFHLAHPHADRLFKRYYEIEAQLKELQNEQKEAIARIEHKEQHAEKQTQDNPARTPAQTSTPQGSGIPETDNRDEKDNPTMQGRAANNTQRGPADIDRDA